MQTRMLRDIEVSEVGMGCMAFSHGYGQIPEEEYSIEAIRNAYNYGCTFFDTAEVYSAPAEQNLFQRIFTAFRSVFTDAVEYFS